MEPMILAIFASLSVLGLLAGVLSIVFQWKNVKSVIDVSSLSARITQLEAGQLDMFDRIEHWMKRGNVRKAREKREENILEETPIRETPREWKARMRRQLAQGVHPGGKS